MSTKNTILKRYDGRFKDIFEEVYQAWVLVVFWWSGLSFGTSIKKRGICFFIPKDGAMCLVQKACTMHSF